MAPVAAHEQVAPEQQRVGVQVDGAERGVERQRALRRVRRRGGERAEAALDAADEPVEDRAREREAGGGRGARGDGGLRPAAGHAPKARPRVGRIQTGTL